MTQHGKQRTARRTATYTPLMALLLTFMMAMMAFGIDIGWIVMSQSELQNAADAAALAGAGPLMDGYVQYNLPLQTDKFAILTNSKAAATAKAKNYASYNTAGGLALTLKDADIQYGFTNASGTYTADSIATTTFPNTIKVTLRRDNTANTPLGLFFGTLLGKPTVDLQATAASTIYTVNYTDFQTGGGMLPMTLDINAWNTYLLTGQSSDGTFRPASNGSPQMQVYPSPNLAPGNFGMLSLDNSSNSASTIRDWINNGLSSSDVQTLHTAGLMPISATNPNWNWKGAPGFKASDLNELDVGDIFILPLFKPVVSTGTVTWQTGTDYQSTMKNSGAPSAGNGGVGQNAYYNIVQFVGVKITYVDKSKAAYIQPVAVLDPAALYTSANVAPAGTTGSLITTFAPPKLTQ